MSDGAHRVRLERIVERVAPLAVLGDPTGIECAAVVFDHRRVVPGALFCCVPGEHRDGHDFAAAARAAGAVAFVCEHSLGPDFARAVQLVVGPGESRAAMAKAAGAFFANPAASMRMVGVTGTNGKTTTTYLLRSILERHGWRTGIVGTLGGARTTPEAPDLQRLLAQQRDAGCAASAVEVTSHALVQHRVDGIRFDVAVFTNLTQDHLDFHKTMEAYFAAKASLFTPERARLAVVCADDEFGRRLISRPEVETVAYSLDDARDLRVGLTRSTFTIEGRPVRLGIGGSFNVRNALGAAAAARALGVGTAAIVAGLEAAERVPGRFETIESLDGLIVIVDYAHTPSGLEEVLGAARQATALPGGVARGRVVVVFGCGGDRDRGKRPKMGYIASRDADLVVLTSDNPRSEDPAAIVEEIRAGVSGPAECVVETNRRAAIALALRSAGRGDVVVVSGKGHERTQEFATGTVSFDDRDVVREELARLGRAVRGHQGQRSEGTPA
ncbi:MAG TPA: UDP-N-acetylmuramoyl-L-alanyl-D-glutamate--2,6-diaminopimelate ligase [Acidimicrobiales bacterium]|nr:UDP-N-acetylmuramoyl-L-alanyl-D-glutamate--2,6-diaminopimelate ligase [Acidimicrobiales bacterium]